MKILRAQVQGFQRVVMLDVTPTTDVVEVRGQNGDGKTSLLDSIQAALGGADSAPIKPIRTGDDFAAIRLTIGDGKPDLIVTKYFDEVGEKLRVENAEGAEWKAGQTHVSNLLGRMTFDPLAFAKMKATEQAVELRRLVPLAVDLDALAKADRDDTAARRDVNRDAKALKARLDVIPVETDLPEERPDLNALTAALAGAAEVNTAIERERDRRERKAGAIADRRNDAVVARRNAEDRRERAALLIADADALEAGAVVIDNEADSSDAELVSLPPLDQPVDTTAASAAIAAARATLDRFARKDVRDKLAADFEALRAQWAGFDQAIKDRAAERAKALAEAQMPVPGLALARVCDVVPGDESEELIAVYEGEPFAQASGAQQLRVSMRLAMAANPRLRVMLIRDGSLLDTKGMALVREMAGGEGYQVWLEAVGEGDGSGLIMEAGRVRGAPEPERLEPPKRRKAKAEGEPGQVATEQASDAEIRAASSASSDAPLPRTAGHPPTDPAVKPARRKPSELRKPPGDLFGGGE